MQLLVLSMKGLARDVVAGYVTHDDLSNAMAYLAVGKQRSYEELCTWVRSILHGFYIPGEDRLGYCCVTHVDEDILREQVQMVVEWIVRGEHNGTVAWTPFQRDWRALDAVLRAGGHPSIMPHLMQPKRKMGAVLGDIMGHVPDLCMPDFTTNDALAHLTRLNQASKCNRKIVTLLADDEQFGAFADRLSLRKEWITARAPRIAASA